MAALATVLLAARLVALPHPVPVHGDDQRFALGAVFVAKVISGSTAQPGYPDLVPVPWYAVHHPGYPLWIGLATPLILLGVPAYAALTFWTVVASLLDPLIFYRLAARRLPDAVAWWLALAYGLGPMYWFLSVTALNYTAGSAFAVAIVWFAWRAADESRTRPAGMTADAPAARRQPRATVSAQCRDINIAVLLCGIGMGIRPDLLAWHAPLLLWVAVRCGRREVLRVAAGLAVACVFWIAICSWLYRLGAASPAAPQFSHTLSNLLATSVFHLGLIDGLARNATKLIAYVGWGLGPAAVALIVVAVPALRRLWRQDRPAVMVLGLWLAPALAFNLLLHMTEAGHTIWHLPALYLLVGIGLARRPRRNAAAAVIALAGAAQFCFYPWAPESRGWKRVLDAKVAFMSRSGLRQIDRRGDIHTPGDFWPTKAHQAAD